MKALVTGGTGFIGSHVVDALLSRGYDVRCIVRKTSNLRWLHDPAIEKVTLDGLLDLEGLKEAMKGIDVLFHVAGSLIEKDWEGFYNANVKPVEMLYQAAEAVGGNLKRYVLVSSTGAAGPSFDGRPRTEDDPPHPVSTYGRSKLEGERVAQTWFDRIPSTIIRPSAVYGPRDPNFVVIFKQVRRGLVPLIGRGEHYANLVHGQDLARAIVDAAEAEKAIGQTYTIASARPIPRSELFNTVGDVYGRRARTIELPARLALGLAKSYSAFMIKVLNRRSLLDPERLETIAYRYWSFDISKAQKDLNFKEEFSLHEGMKQTYEWYLEHGWLDKDLGR